MTIFVSILGLGLLIFVHELGHFVASLALKMRPRKFYVGFPPAVWKTTRGGIEYGIGSIPLGGFVKIPGMHRPAGPDVDHAFARAVEEVRELSGPCERLRRALVAGDHDAARAERDALAGADRDGRAVRGRPAVGRQRAHRHRRRARARRVLARGDLEARDRDRRRAGREHRPRDRALHRPVHDVRRQGDDDRRVGVAREPGGGDGAGVRATASSRSAARRWSPKTSRGRSGRPTAPRSRSSSCAAASA